ncbi:MAG: helix-turn-helix transcriptional regulator [Solirubrobacterales bacterium]
MTKHGRPAAHLVAPDLVREIREASGLKQAELARRAGMPRSVLSAYESGTRQPSVEAISRIARAGGMQLSLSPRVETVDPARAGRLLEQVLELAEALPFSPKATLQFPRLTERFG